MLVKSANRGILARGNCQMNSIHRSDPPGPASIIAQSLILHGHFLQVLVIVHLTGSINVMSARQRKLPPSNGSVIDNAKVLEQKIKEAILVRWDDLPSWQQDNRYILSGYRPASGSFWGSFSSLGYAHNETVNIYSHLIGAILFTTVGGVLYSVLGSRYPAASKGDVFAFGCFFGGAALCLGMSATYHTISNHSPQVASLGNKLDYVGIVFLTVGSFMGSIFYGFFCEPRMQEIYWTMVSSIVHRAVLYVDFGITRYRPLDLVAQLCRSFQDFELRHGDLIELACSCLWACLPSSLCSMVCLSMELSV